LRSRLCCCYALLRLVEVGGGLNRAVVARQRDGDRLPSRERRAGVARAQEGVLAVGEGAQVQALAGTGVLQSRFGADIEVPRLRRRAVARPDLDLRTVGGIVAGDLEALLGVDVHEMKARVVTLQFPLLIHAVV